ncbi:MAG: hypothetical protein RIQ60_1162 [Pseudomonadota bacterium]|jgi:tripartite-type tricarboxylate transporter receptor subunit TctC
MIRWTQALVASTLALCAFAAPAQTSYPTRPIRLIVPVPAGGPSDVAARALAKGLSTGLGQQVLVENRPGGDTGIGAGLALNAAPDGYTLLFALASTAGLPQLSKAAPYRSLAEFAPIATVGGNTQCLVVPSSLGVKSLAEFAAQAKSSPKPLQRGANNAGEDMVAGHVTAALGITLDRIPYKGVPQLMPDLLEGRVQAAVMPVAPSLPQVRAGRLVMLGCSSAERLAALPAVPTLAEGGVTAAPLITAHFVVGPPRLPAELVERLAAAVQQVTQTPEYQQEMERLMIVGRVRPPAETRELIQQVEAQYRQFVHDTGAHLD